LPSRAPATPLSGPVADGGEASAVRAPLHSRRGEISRAALVNRLRAAGPVPLVTIVAPAGYGKTTLLAQWAARDARRFAVVELGASGTDGTGQIARIVSAVRATEPPFVLVADDAEHLAPEAAGLLTTLVQRLPEGSTIALAGQAVPLASIPRLRASGELLELGPDDLALTRREVRALLHELGVTLPDEDLTELHRSTEGWPAGVRAAAAAPAGDDADTGEDLRAGLLGALSARQRDFLRRTSILERLSAPLCDAILGRRDSASRLASLESSVFLVPVDRKREWFRHHRAFREQLRRELDEREPSVARTLERRAADWFEASGDAEGALEHALAGGDVERVVRILERLAMRMHNSGRDADLAAWIAGLEASGQLAAHPRLAALAARLHVQHGETLAAERCLASAGGERRVALVRAAMCAGGAESMLVDVESVIDELPADDRWRPYGLLLQGCAYALLDEPDRADAILSRAAHAAERLRSTETLVVALTERSLLAAARGERALADALVARALESVEEAGLGTYPTCALTLAVSARSELLHGHGPGAAAALARARGLSDPLTSGLPWLALQTRLELGWAYVTLRDSAAAEAVLVEIDELLATRPKLGALARERDRLAAEIHATPANGTGRAAGLTKAELRLLPLLATHLSFREIGLRFYLSRNTVKTQAISVYRKLGASSRSEAVERAQRLGLLEPGAEPTHVIPAG
jgi:LuxR family transcriptional regulator, maltose regulon positive regulatory protein